MVARLKLKEIDGRAPPGKKSFAIRRTEDDNLRHVCEHWTVSNTHYLVFCVFSGVEPAA
jgi:hypothetical protein